MTKMWSSLMFCAASLVVAAPNMRARLPTPLIGQLAFRLAGVASINPDYTAGNMIGFSAWGDYDFSKYWGSKVERHLGEFITPGDITENSYFVARA